MSEDGPDHYRLLKAPHQTDQGDSLAAIRGEPHETSRALELLGGISLKRYGHVPLLARIWQLRQNAWPYDAAYVALAESLNADLVTVDGKFGKIPGTRCTVRNLCDR